MLKVRYLHIMILLLFASIASSINAYGQAITADIVQADRLRSNDTGNNGQFWERTEDSQNTLRYLYGPLSGSPAKVDINNPLFQRLRITGRGSLISVGRNDLGADVALPTGAGGRMMWSIVKRAFRVGEVTDGQWNDVNVGQTSIALGFNTMASGVASIALGNEATAAANNSAAVGNFVGALASNSFTIGSGAGLQSLNNNISNSLMVGFNSNIPTLFVGPSTGAGTTGNVGIGTTDPQNNKLYVNGDTLINGTIKAFVYARPSDIRLKTNIRNINNALEKVLSLKGIEYNWKTTTASTMAFPTGTQLGFAAQDVEKILPNIVSTDANGYKAVSYEELIAVLVEGMKEQQKMIEQQKAELKQVRTALKLLTKKRK
ncbi:MAG: tail fiber domain-containing protein [Acidobacteriota bacterium]